MRASVKNVVVKAADLRGRRRLSVAQAIQIAERRERRKPSRAPLASSTFAVEKSEAGAWKRRVLRGREVWMVSDAANWHLNLTTDAASGFTNRRDWQSKIMAGGFAPFATAVGFATSTGATTLTNSGASFPTAGQGLSGMMVVAGPNNAGAGATVWGMIQSNTGTALTVDQWYNGGTWAVGSTPNGTAAYIVVPGGVPAMWLALTSSSGPANTDTTLAGELTSNGFARALGTYAHTAAASTYSLQAVFTCSGGAGTTINMECVGGSLVAAKGVMPFESSEPTPPSLLSGDVLTQNVVITVG